MTKIPLSLHLLRSLSNANLFPHIPRILRLIKCPFPITSHNSKHFPIFPCSNSDSCNGMLGYKVYTDLKVSEVASLFQVDPIAIFTANAIDISYPDVENHILPSQLFLKIPISCSCVDGIRKSVSTHYKRRPSDTLASISDSIYSGLVSADQIREANSISDPAVLDVGETLVVPLPCTCFNGTDNSLPAIYLSYVVTPEDTLAGIAARYTTTLTDLMKIGKCFELWEVMGKGHLMRRRMRGRRLALERDRRS